MNGTKHILIGVFIGIVSSISLNYVYALTVTEKQLILEEQSYAQKYTGDFYTDTTNPELQIHTYETLCKGFYILEDDGITRSFTGYGDLADDYTYSIEVSSIKTELATTSKNEIPISISTTTDSILQ